MADNPLFEKYGQTTNAGKAIFHEGESGDRMFIIQNGRVRISKMIDGREHELAILEKGDFFGEMAIVSRISRTATATAVNATQLLAFDRQGFTGMIEKNAKIALNVIDKLCRRLENANSQIQLMFQRNQRSLIALNLHSKFRDRPENEQHLPLDKVVEQISLNLETPGKLVSSYLDGFVAAGILSIKGNVIRLIDGRKLSRLAEMGDK
ncbi:MAG: Crp/Fnr family transcriptional regulator [Spirochaetaceae bacterium]|nr:Crp/Fnr family transcriptional regulator [Spirochaetaceae bacterium]